MALPAAADAVIIGGGINGGAIAFNLARLGMRNIVVLEATHVADGASSRGAGIIRTYYADPAEATLALQSLEVYRNWRDEIGGACGYTATGFLWIVGAEGIRELEATVAAQRRLGADSEVLSPNDVARMQPHIATEDIGAAAYEPKGGYGDPAAATASLHAAASRLGARVDEGVSVTSLTVTADRITGVQTTAGPISTPVAVLAAGAWSVPLAASAGVVLPLVPTRMTSGTIGHAPFGVDATTFIDTVADVFYRPTSEPGVAHVSVRDARHNSALDPSQDWQHERVAASASAQAIHRLRRRIPRLDATPLRAWVGADGVTPDRRAIYGTVPSVQGLFLCVGGNYKGFKVAPAVGRHLAGLIVTGSSSELATFNIVRAGTASVPRDPPAYDLASVA